MTQPSCPNCGTPLAVTLAIPGPQPGAPVPQPVPAPVTLPTVPGDPSQVQIGPNVYAAIGGLGAQPCGTCHDQFPAGNPCPECGRSVPLVEQNGQWVRGEWRDGRWQAPAVPAPADDSWIQMEDHHGRPVDLHEVPVDVAPDPRLLSREKR